MTFAIIWLVTFILIIQGIIVVGFLALFYQMGKLAHSDLRRRLAILNVDKAHLPSGDLTGVYKREELGNGRFKISKVKPGDDGVIAKDYKETLDWIYGREAS